MFLRRIVLHGFKSFADRTEFDFGPGITSIVGPNGCGKSNVLDALRWVLGEQSARSLRGEKMADVIFSGSRSRKPANAAEVELVFDNTRGILQTDATEVVVGRILYRSGDSEYRLNGNACRLKDVRDLFLDTGVGVDAYSVIEQGRVDLLLQANPIERREIFEEAAGISRYKVRRIEAQRKLERAQQNLLRLNDLVDELEKRLRSVKLAAGKARNYQQYDGRLRELRSAFSLSEYHQLELARGRLETDVHAADTAREARKAALGEHQHELARQSAGLAAVDEQIQSTEAEISEIRAEIVALTERIAGGESRIDELEQTRLRRLDQAGEFAARAATLEERIDRETAAMDSLIESERACVARISELHAHRDHAQRHVETVRQALEREKTSAFEAVRRVALVQNQHANVEQQSTRSVAQAERLTNRKIQLETEQAELQHRLAEIDGAIAALEAQIAAVDQQREREDGSLAELRQHLETLSRIIATEKENRSAVSSRLGLLDDMERRLEGIDAGTQRVLAWRNEPGAEGGVIGLVADLLQVDGAHVAALAGVLASIEDQVVVRDGYVFFAERARRGNAEIAARVFAMDRLRPGFNRQSYADAVGFVARAADWVTCADEYRPLAEHLLGRTIIVETLDHALALASSAPEGYTFVTPAGEAISADGLLIFGGRNSAQGLISRKAEIRQLRAELDEIESRLGQAVRDRNGVEASIADGELRYRAMINEIASLQRRSAEMRSERMRGGDEQRRAEREMVVLESELHAVRRGLDEMSRQMDGLRAEAGEAASAQQAHEERVSSLDQELSAANHAAAGVAQDLTAALVEKGRASEKRIAAEDALAEMRNRVVSVRGEASSAEQEASAAAEQIAATHEAIRVSAARREELEQRLAGRQVDVQALRDERIEIRRRIEAVGAGASDLQSEVEQIDAELHALQMSLRETEVRKENLVTRVREELAVELDQLYGSYQHAEQDWEAIKGEIDDLKQKIARLGHVNLDAITELEELQPRFDNLVAQRSDVITSIEQLQGLIAELDENSRVRFAETFEIIRGHFADLFRKLFGGGKADIILEDPANPLECGIEIIARPPGKEPQSISLLSGGEKTMTTVALLMAVFKTRPSPFAVLDEVDAALDESNVERFNSVLHEFLAQSQFVVITHHKRTMQSADVLYGITMEEPGVSKRVSVRFDRVSTPSVA